MPNWVDSDLQCSCFREGNVYNSLFSYYLPLANEHGPPFTYTWITLLCVRFGLSCTNGSSMLKVYNNEIKQQFQETELLKSVRKMRIKKNSKLFVPSNSTIRTLYDSNSFPRFTQLVLSRKRIASRERQLWKSMWRIGIWVNELSNLRELFFVGIFWKS